MEPQLSNELLNKLGNQVNPKNLQKMIKKAQKDPKIRELLATLQKSMTASKTDNNVEKTPKEKMIEKMKQYRVQRGGKMRQVALVDKSKTEQTVEPETSKQDVQTQLIPSMSKIKNNRRKKLRELEKKMGQITEEYWTLSLKKIRDHDDGTTVLSDSQLRHEKYIIELYTKQSEQVKEETLDLEELSDLSDIDA